MVAGRCYASKRPVGESVPIQGVGSKTASTPGAAGPERGAAMQMTNARAASSPIETVITPTASSSSMWSMPKPAQGGRGFGEAISPVGRVSKVSSSGIKSVSGPRTEDLELVHIVTAQSNCGHWIDYLFLQEREDKQDRRAFRIKVDFSA